MNTKLPQEAPYTMEIEKGGPKQGHSLLYRWTGPTGHGPWQNWPPNLDVLNAAFAAGRSAPSPVGQEPTVEQVMDIVSEAYGDMTHRRAGGVNIEALRARLSALFAHPPKAGVLTDEKIEQDYKFRYNLPAFGPIYARGYKAGMEDARDRLSPKP